MRRELSAEGVRELLSAREVDEFMKEEGDGAVVLVNSVCGCAAGSARPAFRLALRHPKAPARSATVFAGQDLEAAAQFRSYIADIPPSSPSVAVFTGGRLVHFIPRHMIEGRSPEEIATDLGRAFEQHC
jgi:putative YphP/YqiW family bacilliredoxin